MLLNGNGQLRILYLVTRGTPGGAQTHVLHLASRLSQEHEVHVATGTGGDLGDRLERKGIPVHYTGALARELSPARDFKALMQITGLLKKIKPHLASTHSSKAGMLGRLAARICGVPAVFTAHGWAFTEGIPEGKRKFYTLAERAAARWARKIICVSEYDRQLALQYGVGREEQLITIHNGIPGIAPDYLADPGRKGPLRLVMIARFSEQKDHPLLLKALHELQLSGIEVQLVGDGPLLESMQEKTRQLGLENKVKFLGSRQDIHQILAGGQIFLLLSRWEGFPRSILEAMRAGLPVIASSVGGTAESVIDGATGFLVPRGDAETLKDRLLQLVYNPELRAAMGKEGRSRYLRHFTYEHMFKQTVNVYSSILYSR